MSKHDENASHGTPGGKGSDTAPADPRQAPPRPDPQAGIDREVGDLENPDAVDDEGALPGRAGGGLAGG
ncbi:hypothetical protein [Xanthomonas sp. 1678]|uniref:hypothetical protein n=1 Tax=Xanthomonas sp. 1678 TaxID=3158788 RepID=UPI0028615517|nr:hypothetical protein [Xanthomonas translucens]